jgi:hypothetical protein
MQEYSYGSKSRRAKRYGNVTFNRPRLSSVQMAKNLGGGLDAYKVADNHVRELKRGIEAGALGEGMTGKDLRRNLGFWQSVRGYAKRNLKEIPTVSARQ